MADQMILTAEPTVSEAPGIDLVTISIALLPLLALILLLMWGKKKKGRKKRTVELSYNIIALELLLFLLLPICKQPFDCALWAAIPIIMFAALLSFMYHSLSKEANHHIRIAKAMSEGHVDKVGLLQGEIEEDLAREKKNPQKKEKPRDIVYPNPPKSKNDHEQIERTIDEVLKKKSKKGTNS